MLALNLVHQKVCMAVFDFSLNCDTKLVKYNDI